ncbi:hypothetical protein SVIO_046410 [Streptomyces violaceusniger]|uniref:Uncharacterized protein n=1 Tax=Streptomyces violaceusniger TaxID=68280 RepID=A0A4D4L647_STRVO|nr:hypothetical protein SVIO_046410 [Streptomyces violaceusniger]
MSDEPQLIDGGAAGTGDRPGTGDGNHDTPHRADGLTVGKPAKGRKGRPQRTGWRRLLPTWRMVLGASC